MGGPWEDYAAAPKLPRGLRNNNPGNIEDGPFARSIPGYQGSDGRFAVYDSMDNGKAAHAALLGSYGRKGINTVEGVVNRWAPPTENDSGSYARFVSQKMGVDPRAPLDMNDPKVVSGLAAAMAEQENGVAMPASDTPPWMDYGGQAAAPAPARPVPGQPGAAPMPQRPAAVARAPSPNAMPKADVMGEAWSGLTQPFRDLGSNFMAGVENQRRIGANPTAAMPRNVSQFLKAGVESVKGSAGLVGDLAGLASAPIQAVVRPVAAAGVRAGLQPSVGGDKLTFVNGKPVVSPYRKTSGAEAQAVIEGDINTALSAARPATVKPILPKPKGMTLEAVKEANTKAWKAVDDSGYRFPANQVKSLAADVRTLVNSEGPELYPEADKIARRMEQLAQRGELTPAQANRLRSQVGEKLLAPGSTEVSVGGAIKAKIDGMIDSANDPSLAKARELHTRYKKMEEVSNRVQSAELAQETAGTGGNQNAIRQKLKPLIDTKSPQRIRNLTADETKAIRKVTKGTPTQNALRLLTAFDPTAGKLQAMLSGGMAASTLGKSLLMAPVGMAAKIGEQRMSAKSLDELLKLISTGGTAPKAPAFRGVAGPYAPLTLPAKVGGTGALLAPLPQVQHTNAKTKTSARR